MGERLKLKTSFITGGGRGLGRGICLALAKAGSDVVVTDVIQDNADGVAKEVKDLGREALSIQMDVTNIRSIDDAVRGALDKFNGIDILVNNAGVIKQAPILELSEEDWDFVIGVNAKGVFLCSKALAPQMIERQSGRIVNLSSISGKNGYPGMGAYASSKFAVIGLTQVLARELACHNITVNAICPGIVYTHMQEYLSSLRAKETGMTAEEVFNKIMVERIPLGRPQTTEDIGNLVVFLASDEARNITGQAINVDGGMVTH